MVGYGRRWAVHRESALQLAPQHDHRVQALLPNLWLMLPMFSLWDDDPVLSWSCLMGPWRILSSCTVVVCSTGLTCVHSFLTLRRCLRKTKLWPLVSLLSLLKLLCKQWSFLTDIPTLQASERPSWSELYEVLVRQDLHQPPGSYARVL